MRVEFDEAKRRLTLDRRGLDMARAIELFAGATITAQDDRRDYGESRYLTVGYLDGRMVMVVWTPRGEHRRIISMRRTNERETATYAIRLDRS
jgi:uncharacterized DUF497 family protein